MISFGRVGRFDGKMVSGGLEGRLVFGSSMTDYSRISNLFCGSSSTRVSVTADSMAMRTLLIISVLWRIIPYASYCVTQIRLHEASRTLPVGITLSGH